MSSHTRQTPSLDIIVREMKRTDRNLAAADRRDPQPTGREPGLKSVSGGLRDVPADPRDQFPTAEVIRARVKRTALVPGAVTIPCDAHSAAVGEFCFSTAHGVCAERVKARAAKR